VRGNDIIVQREFSEEISGEWWAVGVWETDVSTGSGERKEREREEGCVSC
jgi:hypothetical protein